jgi:ATP-binding cassette subfamily B protein
MIVFSTYAIMALNGFRTLVQIFNAFPRAQASLERISEVLDTEPTILSGTKTEGNGSGSISFKDVTFRYMGSPTDTIRDVSFDVKPGETVAIIGATGCGKATLVDLIPRFYDAIEGTVTIDGIDVKEYDLDSLRSKIGFVSQRSTILSGDVRDNVNYGLGSDKRSDDDVWDALRVACIDEFVESEGGLEINLSEEGRNISGGQKQRISIARGICHDPEILILDDSFSALDFNTELLLRESIKKELNGITKIIITQRAGVTKEADLILVMEDGRIIDQGGHDELIERCQTYRDIMNLQIQEDDT